MQLPIRFYQYKVAPFSGKAYQRNSDRCKGDEVPCAICGQPVKPDDHPYWGIVTDGGARWAPDFADGVANQGAFPVGNGCHRRYVVSESPA